MMEQKKLSRPNKLEELFLFQSTHSLRSATDVVTARQATSNSFNPRTPCGVRHGNQRGHGPRIPVSIHALLAECDFRVPFARSSLLISFNPRTPCGVRPVGMGAHWLFCLVSIHALLAECDLLQLYRIFNRYGSFNPRTPCGVRHFCNSVRRKHPSFNPRTPCGVRR